MFGRKADGALSAVAVEANGSLSIAGSRNPGSATGSYGLSMPQGNVTRLDVDQVETLVTNAPCMVISVVGNDANTGYTDLIDANVTGGGSTPKYRINVGDGGVINFGAARFENGLTIDGESAGHDVTVTWWPL